MVVSLSSHHPPKAGQGWTSFLGRGDSARRGPEPQKRFRGTRPNFLGPETKLLEMECQALELERQVGVRR